MAILTSSLSSSNQLITGSLWSRAGKMELIFCWRSLNLDAVSSFNTNLRVSCASSLIKVTLKERDILVLEFAAFLSTSSLLLWQVNVWLFAWSVPLIKDPAVKYGLCWYLLVRAS